MTYHGGYIEDMAEMIFFGPLIFGNVSKMS